MEEMKKKIYQQPQTKVYLYDNVLMQSASLQEEEGRGRVTAKENDMLFWNDDDAF